MWSAGRSILLCGYLCCIVVLCFLLSMRAVTATEWPTQKVLQSVVRIAIDNNGTPMTCTAFAVPGQGRFVTAQHCTNGAVTIGTIPVDVLEVDDADDLAVLQLRNDGSLPPLMLGKEPKMGDATLAVGYPLGVSGHPMVFPSTFQGVFDGFDDGNVFAVFVGNAMPGMSGGPIVNTRGEVVSVVLGGGNPSMAYQNMGFGARYDALRRLLLKYRVN